MKIILAILALTLVSGSALAEGARAKKPVTCQSYSIAKLEDGSTIGMCQGKPGKKPRILSTYTLTTVKDPSGAQVKVLVGYP